MLSFLLILRLFLSSIFSVKGLAMAQDGKFNTPLKIVLATPSACNNYERYFKRISFKVWVRKAILLGGLNFACYSILLSGLKVM